MAGLMDAFERIESGGNPLVWNSRGGRRSRYRGLFQFGPDQERRYGITDWTNPDQQRRAFTQHIGGLRSDLSRRLGRDPADWELYFGHQQGPSGSTALLTAAPGTAAWRAIRRYYGSDALAQQAIMGNIPHTNPLSRLSPDQVTAADFAQMWQQRFGRAMPGGGGGAPLGAPVTPPPGQSVATATAPPGGGDTASPGGMNLQAIMAGLSGIMGGFSPISTASATEAVPPPTSLPAPPPSGGPPDDATLGGGAGMLPRGTVRSLLGSFTPAPPPPGAPTVPPFGAPIVTPAPPSGGSFSGALGESEIQPEGRSVSMPIPEAPPINADAIVRGAQQAAADRTAGQPRQPNFLDRLMQNPAFLAGLSILGTAPGGNWGPAGAQAASQAFRSQRERTEFERLQNRRSVMDRVWREAFPNGAPNLQHPLMQGLPPEMAQTIFAMGPEEGLQQLQRWQFFRGQQAEQRRIRQAELSAFGIGPPPSTPPPSGDGMEVATGDRLRTGAGLGAIQDTSGVTAPPSGPPSIAPPPGSGVGIAQPPPAPAPSPPPRSGPSAEPMVRIGTREMPVSQARALALATPDAGMRSVMEEAIKAAERNAQPPEAIRTRALQTDTAFRTISGALQNYVDLVKRTGITALPGQDSDAVKQARTDLLLQLKELYNLGVLNGPDLALMEGMVHDPSVGIGGFGPGGMVPGISGFSNLFTSPGNRAEAMAGQLMTMLLRIRNSAAGAAGMPPITAPGGGSGGGGTGGGGGATRRYNPQTGRLE
jgi:hypothetical protein